MERQQLGLLRQNIEQYYEQFSGRTLEQYFQQKMMETGQYMLVGNWWDRKGVNEIDLIALNEFDKTGIVAEVKRLAERISLKALEKKMSDLPSSDFGKYTLCVRGLSMGDMWSSYN